MLEAPPELGLPESAHEHIQAEWSTFNKVQDQLRNEGFTPLPMPNYGCPQYVDPDLLNTQDSRKLTIEFARYKAWRDFTAERLMYSKQILLEVSKMLAKIESGYKHQLTKPGTKRPTREEVLDACSRDPQYAALEKQEQEQKQFEITYETKLSEYGTAMQLISRSITMRGQDIDQGRRAGNIGAGVDPREFPR